MSGQANGWIRNGRVVVRPAKGRRAHALVALDPIGRARLVCGRRLAGAFVEVARGDGAGNLVTCRDCWAELGWVGGSR